jgi:hypothetical protein
MNFSLRTLLVFMAGAAVVSASLVSASPIVGDLFYTVALLTIPFAGVAALYQRGPQRAACIGFLLVFTSYFFHTLWPSEIRATWLVAQRGGEIDFPTQNPITTRMLSFLFQGLHGDFPISANMNYGDSAYEVAAKFVAFQTVGNFTIGLLLGLVGGAMARRFASTAALTTMDTGRQNSP